MSFEGYYEYRCECKQNIEGGYNVYDFDSNDINILCPCGKPYTEVRTVDTTNSPEVYKGKWKPNG
jgi:hypothetical protein